MTWVHGSSRAVATLGDPSACACILSALDHPIDAVWAAITGENGADTSEPQPSIRIGGVAVSILMAPVVDFIVEPVAIGAGIPNVLPGPVGQAYIVGAGAARTRRHGGRGDALK